MIRFRIFTVFFAAILVAPAFSGFADSRTKQPETLSQSLTGRAMTQKTEQDKSGQEKRPGKTAPEKQKSNQKVNNSHKSGPGTEDKARNTRQIRNRRKTLLQKKENLDRQYKALIKERQKLKNSANDLGTEEKIEAYNQRVRQLNKKIRSFRQKRSKLESEIREFNSSVNK
ncbi:MAG: hypothetical protein KGY38_03295 [Desulfobacterales bacterium]|nr:hypothetical protein [Desulfobacterales bacterium]